MTRDEFIRRLLAAPIVGFYAPEKRQQQPVVVRQTISFDGREVVRAVHRYASERKAKK